MESKIKIITKNRDRDFNLFFDYQQKTCIKWYERKWSEEKKCKYYDCLLRHSGEKTGGKKLRNTFYSLDKILDLFDEIKVKKIIAYINSLEV